MATKAKRKSGQVEKKVTLTIFDFPQYEPERNAGFLRMVASDREHGKLPRLEIPEDRPRQ